MIEKFLNIFRVPDLRKRVLFTLAMLAVYRLGSHVPTPGINSNALAEIIDRSGGGLLGYLNLFSGGNFRRLTIFALGIMPYITASIILQLLTVVYEPLAKLQKEGELGRKKITTWTRYLTVVLSAFQSAFIAINLQNAGANVQLVTHPGPGFVLMTILTLTTGSAFIMWLGEQITERGIGNGMSLLIFSGIVVGLPRAIMDLAGKVRSNAWGSFTIIAIVVLLLVMLLVIAFVVFVERSERRIPVQYAKRIVGRRMMGGQQTYMPLKVNAGGVMPVIFASSILSFPLMLAQAQWVKSHESISHFFKVIGYGEPTYTVIYAVGIIFFAYFYVSIVFNPRDVSDNMRKYGGFIPGIRPGERTGNYINDVLTRITLAGAFYLIVISLIPQFMLSGTKFNDLPWFLGRFFEQMPTWFTNGLGINFYFGGTSLLIVVGVAMDTVNQIESQLVMRHYEGFTPRSGRIRGRRAWA